MAIADISPVKYGKVLAKALPKVIETREEFHHYVEMTERLDRVRSAAKRSPRKRMPFWRSSNNW